MSSAARLAIALLPACNSVFGLHELDPASAPYYDAPIDARPTCPPIGTAPRFLPLIHQYLQQPCRDYSISASGTAIAWCSFDLGGYQVAIGAPRQQLEPVLDVIGPSLFRPRLSSDDQRIYIGDAVARGVREYTRTGSGWKLTQMNAVGLGTTFLGTIGRSPSGDRVIAASGTTFDEWEYGMDGTWHALPTTLAGMPSLYSATLTTDSLRLIAETDVGTMVYADRPDTASSFGVPQVLTDVPFLEDAFLSDDCARIYATGLGQIAYLDAR